MKKRKITLFVQVISFSSIQSAILCHSELLTHDPNLPVGKMEAVNTAKFKLMGFSSPLL
jgi:hypothetical protein